MMTNSHMIGERFSIWKPWDLRNSLPRVKYPGIYAISLPKNEISGTNFSWREDIIYIGVTNSISGLKGRLGQFDQTIKHNNNSHGGAQRVRFKHPDYDTLSSALRVSVISVECDVKSKKPEDLRIMGDILKLEFECFAEYVEQFSHLPEFNDIKRSPKK